jgi:NAD(P)-dependent dehydrogenase (short-subunit alcohol dehydrogenase family)
MMKDESPWTLSNRHAIVTGASRGIGAEIAAALVAEGVCVSLLGRDEGRLDNVSRDLGGTQKAFPVTVDVADSISVRAAFAAARRHFGPVAVLINNAGQAASAKFVDTDETLWHAILGANLTGTYLCTREAVPDMLQLGFGRIINIASVAGLRGAAYISAYAASKHAVIGLTRSLALEFARTSITVNAICPGYTDTDIVKTAVAKIKTTTGRSEEDAIAALVAANPQGRFIQPREIAHTALWLCKPGTESVSGQSIVIAGGEVM